VALTVFYAALFLFAPTIIDAIPDATKNVLIIAMMVGAVLSLILSRRQDLSTHTFHWRWPHWGSRCWRKLQASHRLRTRWYLGRSERGPVRFLPLFRRNENAP
jgi:hypothetical protein